MLFEDYTRTTQVYHIIELNDLDRCLKYGINYDDKNTYKNKYSKFHGFFDEFRSKHIPDWVMRQKAIYASLNFDEDHKWHSHTAILGINIHEDRCWICNENIANFLFEPFTLQSVEGFQEASAFIKSKGVKIAQDYWNTSISFKENLKKRNDLREGYDAEVLIMHNIPPRNIECLMIISDHRLMNCSQWKSFFRSDNLNYRLC